MHRQVHWLSWYENKDNVTVDEKYIKLTWNVNYAGYAAAPASIVFDDTKI